MKKLWLDDSDENIENSFLRNILGRNKDILAFVDLINNFNSGVIAINAPWGAGKTFFIKQTKLVIDNLS